MTTSKLQTIGIIGAGKVGVVLAQLALKAGYSVLIAGSGDPQKIALSMSVLAPGAESVTTNDAVQRSDIIILALPLGKYLMLPKTLFAGKLVLDATNYWWETDGVREDFEQTDIASTRLIQNYLTDAVVVKAFNHMGYHDLFDGPRTQGSVDRKAIAIAGDNDEAILNASEIVNNFGFDPVYAGTIDQSTVLQPHGRIFGTNPSKAELEALLSK